MMLVLSPSKTMDFSRTSVMKNYTIPSFLKESQELIDILKQISVTDLMKLMKLSSSLAELNHERHQSWRVPFPEEKSRPAIFAFKGDVYEGLRAENFTVSDLEFSMKHLRILSGLYGLLRPLDLMMPYRLEMNTNLKNSQGKNLYKFWGDKITDEINKSMKEQGIHYLVNLASTEYFKAINQKLINVPVVSPVFIEKDHGRNTIVGIHTKKARGMMTHYIISNRITDAEDIKSFDRDGYQFDPKNSTELTWFFSR
ncbi:MAG: peroxide stress protein YaaA [Bacteroidetes bacterium HGW-Bacteroidetes-21]|nr:MAG: peroxide stress protein YaaA [Bacteroidetes bacterium HGW-Bacteroidetes-21]